MHSGCIGDKVKLEHDVWDRRVDLISIAKFHTQHRRHRHKIFTIQTMTPFRCWKPIAASTSKMSIRSIIYQETVKKNRFTVNNSSAPLRWPIQLSERELSSSSTTTSTDDRPIVLYRRDESRNVIARSLFLFTSFNTAYWVWYVMDFVPALSAADLQVDPSWGYAGLGIGLVSNFVVGLYGTSLVSSISYDPKGNCLLVSKHTLPFLRGSASSTTYSVGDLVVEASSSDKIRIIERGIERYQGHLSLRSSRNASWYPPLLLEVREPNEVNMNPNHLTEMILLVHSDPSNGFETKTPRKKLRRNVQETSPVNPKLKRKKQQSSSSRIGRRQ